MKKVILNLENVENAIWIKAEEIEKIVVNADGFKLIEGNNIDLNLVERINEFLDKYDTNLDESTLEEFFYRNNLENVFERLDDEVEFKEDFDVLFDYNGKCEVCQLSDFDTHDTIRVWINGNWKTCYIENIGKEYEVDNLEFCNLDEWDGNNWYTGTKNCHAKVTKLADGEYLILEWSEYMEDPFTTAIEASENELEIYLEKYNRLQYFEEIKNLKVEEN